jgi:hypothetical protein
MFFSLARKSGTQDCEVQRPNRCHEPHIVRLDRGAPCARYGGQGTLKSLQCAVGRMKLVDLCPPPRPGKFHQVAPQVGPVGSGCGARLILENSTVCQKSTN